MFHLFKRVRLPRKGPIDYKLFPQGVIDRIKHASKEIVETEKFIDGEYKLLFVQNDQADREARIAFYFKRLGELIILKGFLERFTVDEAYAVLQGIDKPKPQTLGTSISIVEAAKEPLLSQMELDEIAAMAEGLPISNKVANGKAKSKR